MTINGREDGDPFVDFTLRERRSVLEKIDALRARRGDISRRDVYRIAIREYLAREQRKEERKAKNTTTTNDDE